jgi:hypothetical protein
VASARPNSLHGSKSFKPRRFTVAHLLRKQACITEVHKEEFEQKLAKETKRRHFLSEGQALAAGPA